jgi:hypothetical protein
MQTANELTARGVAFYDCWLSGFGGGKGFFFEEQTKPTILFYSAMTGDALVIENGFYLGAEIDLLRILTGLSKYDQCQN